MSGRLYGTLQYLLGLLRSSRFHLLRFLRNIAYCILRPVRPRKPSIVPRSKPRALPTIRPRALTPPPSPRTALESPPTTFAQLQSPLFSNLPLEIRRLIYHHALVSRSTHIVRLGPRLGHIRCRLSRNARPWDHRCWGITVNGSDLYHGPHDGFPTEEETEENKPGLLPLVMACRRIYTEAMPVLYGDNTFSMLHLESVMSLADTILPQRLNTIRSVELGWYFYIPYPLYTCKFQPMDYPPNDIATWERVWSILANMEGLVTLRIDLKARWMEPLTVDEERQLLAPAMVVRTPRAWEMRLDWKDAGVDWEAQGAPFRVARFITDWP